MTVMKSMSSDRIALPPVPSSSNHATSRSARRAALCILIIGVAYAEGTDEEVMFEPHTANRRASSWTTAKVVVPVVCCAFRPPPQDEVVVVGGGGGGAAANASSSYAGHRPGWARRHGLTVYQYQMRSKSFPRFVVNGRAKENTMYFQFVARQNFAEHFYASNPDSCISQRFQRAHDHALAPH